MSRSRPRAGSGGPSVHAFGDAEATLGDVAPERVQESDELYLLSAEGPTPSRSATA